MRLLVVVVVVVIVVLAIDDDHDVCDEKQFTCLDADTDRIERYCPKTVPMSSVDDGVCDCCDASDEKSCENVSSIFSKRDVGTFDSYFCNRLVYREKGWFSDDVVFGRPRCSRENERDVEISMDSVNSGIILRPALFWREEEDESRNISFWTKFPFKDPYSEQMIYTAVGGSISSLKETSIVHSSHVSAKQNRIGFFHPNHGFVDLGLDISTLSKGWYHLSIVTSLSSTTLYLNGKIVYVSSVIQRDAVGTIGSPYRRLGNTSTTAASWPSPMRYVRIQSKNQNQYPLLDHVFIINLLSSTERYQDMQRVLEEHELDSISSRFVAIPGMSIPKSPSLLKLVSELVHIGADGGKDGSFGGKGASGKTRPIGRPPKSGSPGEVFWWNTLACFASHALLWRRLADRPEGRYLIMEDDATLRKGWRERLVKIFQSNLIPDENWDILYLMNFGLKVSSWPPWRGHVVNDYVVSLGPAKDNARNLGTIAYIVRGGPRMLRMLKSVRSIGALNLDVAINLRMDEISAFLVAPEVVQDLHGNYVVNYFAGGRGVSSTRG